ncbi:hypothetical protein P4B35_17670 [Pontiellaceae bacterium B12227]|nr:hypothetical protein [Pontiellaceae bacterium B12227]
MNHISSRALLFLPLVFVLLAVQSVSAEFRIWESTDGTIWEGEFVTMNGGRVVIRDQAGKKNEYKPDALCEADRDYLEKVIPPALSIDVSRSTDSISGSSERVKCIATIKKANTAKYSGELTAVLVMLAEELKTGAYSKAGSATEFKFTLPEKHGVPVQFKSDTQKFLKRSNNSGRAYSGYILVVWDRFGNPVAVKSNRDSFLEKATKIARPKPSLK